MKSHEKALPKIDSMTLCPMCDQIVSSRSQQIYEEHVRICVERNSGEDSALFKGNDDIIGSKQMRTRRSRDGPSMTSISKVYSHFYFKYIHYNILYFRLLSNYLEIITD